MPNALQLSAAEQRLLQDLVYRECGMWFDERRVDFLQERLARRLRACRIPSFYTYYRLVTSSAGRAELATLVENLAIHETSFFRNRPQFEFFQKVCLEETLRRKHERGDWSIRVWSAGCSMGQEPYTIAMLLCDALTFYNLRHPLPFGRSSERCLVPPPWRVEILASDLSYAALRHAQAGLYTVAQMEPVEPSYRLRYFDRTGDTYTVKRAVQDLVHFDFHNLKTEFLPQRNDIIFCRNVMIYFDEAEQKRLAEKLYRCLNRDGYLFIGHAESMNGISDKFRMLNQNNGTAYRKLDAEESA
jgi:chemotaxis protein methyltransferase CheR